MDPSPPLAQRSVFVTVVAWIFIVLSGLGTLVSILQNVMYQALMAPQLERGPVPDPHMPAVAAFLFSHFGWLLLAVLGVMALTFAASIGLLLRRAWARIVFIAMLALGIAWNVGGVLLQFAWMASLPAPPADMLAMFRAMQVVMAIVAFGVGALFGWIIHRLCSPAVVAEFGP